VAAHGFAAPDTGAAYIRAKELCEELGEVREVFPVLYGLCLYHLYAAELSNARRAADRLLELANDSNERGLLFFAHRAAGVSALPAGEFLRARDHLKEALALYDPQGHRSPAFVYAFDPRIVCLDYLARALLPLGLPDQALASNDDAVAEARRIGHRNSLALPLFFGGVVHQILGDCEGVKLRSNELSQISGEAGFRLWQAGATILQAWAAAEEGDTALGRSDLQRGFDDWRSTGAQYMSPYFRALQAQIELKAGDPAVALQLLEEAQEIIERTNERWYAAEVFRFQGEAMLQSGAEWGAKASERFRDALATARMQGAHFWELRAAMGLARASNAEIGAREQLAQIISRFTEGATLPDLKAAKMIAQTQ
jgi:predicted ATPase